MRPLTETEQNRLQIIAGHGLRAGLLQPTGVALEKSIIDAIEPFRQLLVDTGIHDFDRQLQGTQHKVIIPARVLADGSWVRCDASLYRPTTKQGDPRIWFTGLKRLVGANNILAVIPTDSGLHVINLTRPGFEHDVAQGRLDDLFALASRLDDRADELLMRLRQIAQRGPLRAIGHGDTTIGMTIEAALGIAPNSRRTPDYRGIEVKASRNSRANRTTLFGQVPDWSLSGCKSSEEILDLHGYVRGGIERLYCTVNATLWNSQGLKFLVKEKQDQVMETSQVRENVAVWSIGKLRDRLNEKHRATFWVSASSSRHDGVEYFTINAVRYTRNPYAENIGPLIASSIITMDHAIKRKPDGSVTEKGPLFKIRQAHLELLFPPSQTFPITSVRG